MTRPEMKVIEKQIDITSEYDVFERMAGNRPLDEKHVLNLMRRMEKHDLFTPIQINENFEIVDGQHRLEARKRLGLPVPFFCVSEYRLAEVQEINAMQKKWNSADFTESFIERGNRNYSIYKWFRNQYSLSHTLAVHLLMYGKITGHDNIKDIFQSGQLVVADLSMAKEKAEMMLRIQPFFEHWNSTGFARAILFCLRKKEFDFEKFMRRLEANPTMLKPCANTNQYIEVIETIYNFRSAHKVNLRYGEDVNSTNGNGHRKAKKQ
jgi:ParB/Sulfiredoxin domain